MDKGYGLRRFLNGGIRFGGAAAVPKTVALYLVFIREGRGQTVISADGHGIQHCGFRRLLGLHQRWFCQYS